MRKLLLTIFVLGSAMIATGCSQTRPNLPPSTKYAGPSVLVESYKMAVGDEVEINVWKNPELSVSEPVRPDGKVSIPLVGDVMAAGSTPDELSRKIESMLTNYIKSPNVTVILTNLKGHEFLSRIRVTGSVTNNTSLSYHQGMTVLDAVLEAGSIDVYADGNSTKLHRRTAKGTVSYDIHLEDIMQKGDMRSNINLMPGDIITVPERSF